MSSSLQTTLNSLLETTNAFFLSNKSTPEQDRKALDTLREYVLELTAAAKEPNYDRMLAYLLGGISSDAHYPLQCVRMACLTAKALSTLPDIKPDVVNDVVVAAFLADMGFRPSWLSNQGNHRDLGGSHFTSLAIHWARPLTIKIIHDHHDLKEDPSPMKVVFLIAEYLAFVYGTGCDEIPTQLHTPAETLELMLEKHRQEQSGMRLLLRSIGAFVLGSWVRLSSGDVAMVLGNNVENPLRPRVGFYKVNETSKAPIWYELSLATEITIHIVEEEIPTLIQQAFISTPSLWIEGWEGRSLIDHSELQRHFQDSDHPLSSVAPEATDHIVTQRRRVEDLLKPEGSGRPIAQRTPTDLTAAPAEPTGRIHEMRAAQSEEEVEKIREDWEHHAEQVENAIRDLRHGLINSYRRENERYKSVVDGLVRETKAPRGSEDKPSETTRILQPEAERLRLARKGLDDLQHEIAPHISDFEKTLFESRSALTTLASRLADDLAPQTTDHLAVQNWLDLTTKSLCATERQLLDPAQRRPFSLLHLDGVSSAPRTPQETDGLITQVYDDLTRYGRSVLEARQTLQQSTHTALRLEKILLSRMAHEALRRGLAERAAGSTKAAISWFEQAIVWQKDFWEAFTALGLCLVSTDDAQATRCLEKASALHPGDAELEACLKMSKEAFKEAR